MTTHEHAALALELASQGYRRTSNRHRMVSRIDREDWKEYMALQHAPWDAKRGTTDGPDWVKCLGPAAAADFYRRVHSMDSLEGLDPAVFKLIPGSSNDPCGYAPKPAKPR